MAELASRIPDLRRRDAHPTPWIGNLARALAATGAVQMDLITESSYVRKDCTVAGEVEGLTYHVLRSGSAVPFTRRGYPGFFPFDVITRFARSRRRLRRAVERLRPDLIHAHGTEQAYAAAAMDAVGPSLVTLQGIITEIAKVEPSYRYRVVGGLERATVRRGRFFVAKTPFARAFVQSLNPQAVVFDIENAMAPELFTMRPQPERQRVLYVGSLLERKGVHDLVEAFAALAAALPEVDVSLHIVGSGPGNVSRALESRVAALGLAARVRFRGPLAPGAVHQEYAAASVLVLPSHVDNSPNAVSEAMAAGLAVVATRVGGVPFMVRDGETGLLVPPREPAALGQVLRQVLEDAALRRRLAEAGRADALRRFAPAAVAARTLQAYRTVLEQWS